MAGPAHPPPRALLAELARFLRSCVADYRARRLPGPQLDAEAAQDIATDLTAASAACGATAYTAEQEDLAAARLIREALADGHVSPAEVRALRRALALVDRSASRDHDLADALTPTPCLK